MSRADFYLEIETLNGEALDAAAEDPRLNEDVADLLKAYADFTSDDPNAEFNFKYVEVSGSVKLARITYEATSGDLSDLQKFADSLETEFDSDLNTLVTPSGPGGVTGSDFLVASDLRPGPIVDTSPSSGLGPHIDGFDLIA
jgi:hypothetical protein